jgi:uncharacterized protein YdiU (UPF0061 family)
LGGDLDTLAGPLAAQIFAGNNIPDGADPLAMAYAGHQFGHFTSQLGDGRAILLGEVVDRRGVRRDIQLKGSGPTPFSRRGDGRAALGPVLREYLISEAMTAFGIPATRALAAVTTGEPVIREQALPGAVLTRVASSHIRVGTFQFFAARGDLEAVRQLADYTIARHYPEAASAEHPYRALLDGVIARQATLVARWLLIGFIHGVMNTDNTSIAGETIDFGPCAFMDVYNPATVFSSIDETGRYAYGRQPRIAQWNLARLAETLLPLLADDDVKALAAAERSIAAYPGLYEDAWLAGMRGKLGLATHQEGDLALAQDLLKLMETQHADFTLTFRQLGLATDPTNGDDVARGLFDNPTGFDEWAVRWHQRLDSDGQDPAARRALMQRANPAIIPRNHRVEAVISAAVEIGDLAPFQDLLAALGDPYSDRPEFAHYTQPPPPTNQVYKTFCGT